MNIHTALALNEVTRKKAKNKAELMDKLWTCLNVIEDWSKERRGSYKTIYIAVMRAQEIARQLEAKR